MSSLPQGWQWEVCPLCKGRATSFIWLSNDPTGCDMCHGTGEILVDEEGRLRDPQVEAKENLL